MLKVVIVNCVYPPEPVVSARLGYDLAVCLSKLGAVVTVVCPRPTRPYGARYPSFEQQRAVGIEVVHVPSFTAPQSRVLGRMWESFSFGLCACRYLAKCAPDADVVYANTWPLLSQAMLAMFCRHRGIPLVLHIQDVYPESLLVKLPTPLGCLFAPPLSVIDRWSVNTASHIVVICESMRQIYNDDRKLSSQKLTVIPNWTDESLFTPLFDRNEACARYGISSELRTFLYVGNIGPVAGVEFLIDAFGDAKVPNSQLVIAGEGFSKAGCIRRVQKAGLRNVHFLGRVTADNTPVIQRIGHVCLLPMLKGASASSIPSKIMAYMLSARPILATVDRDSDTARCIYDADCVWIEKPEDLTRMTVKMHEVASLPIATLDEFGHRGREYGLKHFAKAEGVRRLAEVVVSSVGR